MKKPEVWHLYRKGGVEVGCTRKGRPSYRWAPGWCRAYYDGSVSGPYTLSNWRAMAKTDGARVRLHDQKEWAEKRAWFDRATPHDLRQKEVGDWLVELEPEVWLAPWSGDPGRCTLVQNAKAFKNGHAARCALGRARQFRAFPRAKVYEWKVKQRGGA